MKKCLKTILSTALVFIIVVNLISCGEGKLLDTIDSGINVYKLYGKDKVSHIKVYRASELLFETDVNGTVTKDGSYEHFGLICNDMDFDGTEDFGLIVSASNGKIRYNCYTYNQSTGKYSKNQFLSALGNISFDNENQNVIEMQISKLYDEPVEGNNDPLDYTESKTKIIYKWSDEELIEQSRTSLVYYSESDIYSYITYIYNNENAEEDTELWIEPSELEQFLIEVQW